VLKSEPHCLQDGYSPILTLETLEVLLELSESLDLLVDRVLGIERRYERPSVPYGEVYVRPDTNRRTLVQRILFLRSREFLLDALAQEVRNPDLRRSLLDDDLVRSDRLLEI
jgi:hypothetical protein